MRPAIISACSAAGFALLGFAMPVAFPDITPWMARGMLGIAAILLAVAFVLWVVGRKGADDSARLAVIQASSGHSVTSHNQSGGITAGVVNVGTREPNALYQDGRKVATVSNGSFTSDKQDEILFEEIVFSDSVDTSRFVGFQGGKLICDTPSIVATAPLFADSRDNVKCKVVK